MKKTKRLIALILVVLLCLSTIPTGIFAEDITPATVEETTVQPEEKQSKEAVVNTENPEDNAPSIEENEAALPTAQDNNLEALEYEVTGDKALPEEVQEAAPENAAAPASAEATPQSQESAAADFTYDTKYDGTLVLTGYTGNAADVVIPGEINGTKVTEVGPWGGTSWTTTHKEAVKSVTVPEGVTSIGSSVFKDCPNLTTVDMPSTLTDCAGFENCPVKTADGFKKATNLRSLAFSGQPIEDVSAIVNCSLQNLGITNTKMTDLTQVKGLNKIAYINVLNVSNNQLASLKGIAGINVGEIDASHNAIRDISALKGSNRLNQLRLNNNGLKKIEDIKGLEDITFLRTIIFRENQLVSLNGIEKVTGLYRVELGDNPDLKDISPLKKLDNLTEISLSGTGVSAKDQFDLMQIKDQSIRPSSSRTFKGKPETIPYQQLQVSVENPEIAELKIASYNSGLEITGKKIGQTKATIAYENNGVTYKKDLTLTVTDGAIPQDFDYKVNNDGQTLTITEYHGPGGMVIFPDKIDGKSVTKVESLGYYMQVRDAITGVVIPEGIKGIGSAFSNLKNLTSVDLPASLEDSALTGGFSFANCALSDLKGFEKVTKVSYWNLSGNKITDISGIPDKLEALYNIDLSGNPIADITPLAQFKKLRSVGLKDTNVTDVSALKELYNLYNVDLTNTQVKDVRFFKALPELSQLTLDGTPVSDADRMAFVKLSDIRLFAGYDQYLDTSAPRGVFEKDKLSLELENPEIANAVWDMYTSIYKITGQKAGETTAVLRYGEAESSPFKITVEGIQAVQPVGKPIGELPAVEPESYFALYADGNLWQLGSQRNWQLTSEKPKLIHDNVKEYVRSYQIMGEKNYSYSEILDFDNNLLIRDLSQAENKNPNISATEYTKTVENVKEYSRLHALNHDNELFRITGEKISDRVDDYYDIIPGGSVILGVCYLKDGNLYKKTDAGEKVLAANVKSLVKPEGYNFGGYGQYGYITQDGSYYTCHWEKQSADLMSYDYELKIEKCGEQVSAVYDVFFVNNEGTYFVTPYVTNSYNPLAGGVVSKVSDQKIKVTQYRLSTIGSGTVYECYFADDHNKLQKWNSDTGELTLITDQFDSFVNYSNYSDYRTKDGKVFTLFGQDVTPPSDVIFKGNNFTLKTDHIVYKNSIAILDKVNKMVGDNKVEEAYAIREDGTIWSLENGPKLYLDGSRKEGDVPVWNMTLTEKASIPKGALQRLVPAFEPENATNQKVSWSSDNEAIATVDENGFVSGIATGTAVITATSEDGGKTASCQVTVMETDKQTIEQGDVQMDVFIPRSAVPEGYAVTVNNTKIPEEKQKALEEYYKDNYKSIVKFVDLSMADKDGNTISQFKETLTIRIKIDQKVDNLKCLTIVYLTDAGYPQIIPTTITKDGYAVFTTDHFSQYALIETKNENSTTDVQENVPVNIPVEGVALDKKDAALKIGETTALKATITPENATNKNVNWSSSDEKVATVKSGVVTAISEGKATITVTTEDGNKTATCIVTVTKKDEPKPTDPTTPTVKPGDNNQSGSNSTNADTTGQTTIKNNGANPGTALTTQKKISTLLVMCTVTALCALAIFSIKHRQTK